MTSHKVHIESLQIGWTASRSHMSGTDRYFQELLHELPAFDIGVRGMVVGEPEAVDDPVPGIVSFTPEGSSRFARIVGARRTAGRLLPGTDLVVSHGPPHAFYVLDRFGRRPFVVHFHGPWALEGRGEGVSRPIEAIRRFQEATVYRRADRFIVLSRAYAETLEREFGVDGDRIRVVPGGVDVGRFAVGSVAEARAQLGWPLDRRIVVAARRLEPTKGIAGLLEAMAMVRAREPDIICMIIGTGVLADSLRAQAQALNLNGNVRFLGHVANADVPLAFRAADVSIVPSVAWEGFGLSAAESLAVGTPVLVTPVGGLPEVVRDLSPSLVTRGTSPGDVADAILRNLHSSTALPDRDTCASYAARFGWKTVAARVSDVYREIA